MSLTAVPPGLDSWFETALRNLVRGNASGFGHLLDSHEEPVTIDGTKTTVRTHFVASDAMGRPAVDQFASAVASSITDFCIPRSRLSKALESWQSTGSTSEIVRLERQARSLFVASEESGEGGELLLFILMEQMLGLPQLMSKMNLKTSTAMHVHGADGVHGALGPDGVLELYWGESKLHKSTSSAVAECFESLAPFLVEQGGETRRQDLLLLNENLNVDGQKLAAHLIRYFDESDPLSLKVRFRGVGLVGFDHASYPNVMAMSETEAKRTVSAVRRWNASIGSHVSINKLSEISIEIFCIPFPSVALLRAAINREIGVAK